MEFDRETKELGRAHDAVDRLREIQQMLGKRQEFRTKLIDRVVRGVLLAILIVVIVYAFMMIG